MENFEVDDDDDGFFTNQESETYLFKAKNKWLWTQVTTPLSDLRTVYPEQFSVFALCVLM